VSLESTDPTSRRSVSEPLIQVNPLIMSIRQSVGQSFRGVRIILILLVDNVIYPPSLSLYRTLITLSNNSALEPNEILTKNEMVVRMSIHLRRRQRLLLVHGGPIR